MRRYLRNFVVQTRWQAVLFSLASTLAIAGADENFGIKGLKLGDSKTEVEAYLDSSPWDCQGYAQKAEDCKDLSIPFSVAGYSCNVKQLLFWSEEPLTAHQRYQNALVRAMNHKSYIKRTEPYKDKSKLYLATILCDDSSAQLAKPSSQAGAGAQSDKGDWGLIEAALTRKYGDPNRLEDSVVWLQNQQRIELRVSRSVQLKLFDTKIMLRREADDALREKERVQRSLEDI